MLPGAADQVERAAKLREQNVASEEELTRKQFLVQNWKARVAKDVFNRECALRNVGSVFQQANIAGH